MKAILQIPLLGFLLIAYNVFALVLGPDSFLTKPLFALPMLTGTELPVTGDTLLLFLGIHALYFEILKSTRTTMSAMIDHALSMIVFVIFLIELLAVKPLQTPTFLLLTVMALLDVIAGFTVSMASARRTVAVDQS